MVDGYFVEAYSAKLESDIDSTFTHALSLMICHHQLQFLATHLLAKDQSMNQFLKLLQIATVMEILCKYPNTLSCPEGALKQFITKNEYFACLKTQLTTKITHIDEVVQFV